MNIFPAIDLFGGKAVRLFKGDYAQMTVYNDDPVSVADDFKASKKTNSDILFAIFAYNFTFSNKKLARWHTLKRKDTIRLQLKPLRNIIERFLDFWGKKL